MKNLAKQLGKNIREQRKKRGLSQDTLALECNLDRSYMGRIERGEVNITVEKLYQIIETLNCDPIAVLPHLSELSESTH